MAKLVNAENLKKFLEVECGLHGEKLELQKFA